MTLLKKFFSIHQMVMFARDSIVAGLDMHRVAFGYIRDVLTTPIVFGNETIGGCTCEKYRTPGELPPHFSEKTVSRAFLCFYLAFLVVFAFNFHGWVFYILCVLLLEIILIVAISFCPSLWPIRFVIISFLYSIMDLQANSGGNYTSVDLAALQFLSDVTFTDIEGWISSYESVTALLNITNYLRLYFLVLFLPYFCATLILLGPLISSFFLFSFGYLIGYVLAGRFAAASTLVSALASYYIWFLYPDFKAEMVSTYGNGLGIFTMAVADDFSGRVNFFWTDPFELRFIQPLKEPAFQLIKDSDHLNLWLDFGTFIESPFFSACCEFVIDSVSIVMVATITTISFLVHLYSTVYMKNDPHQVRFFALLLLFTFFMIVLVMAGNLVMLYIGWEGVGLTSFLLIAFWFTRVPAAKAGVKAMVVNKIGDMFLILAMGFITHYSVGSTTIANIPLIVEDAGKTYFGAGLTSLDVIAISIALAAFVKSAQIFFHTWLADAMEGPTPVSALLHAATMVTAGVYLVIRFSPILEHSEVARWLIFFVGFNTVLMSSAIALAQYDIKKIIAYSTCSQLGLMFVACGMSAYDFALYHFFNHAFFKCLLFLVAGAVIHQLRNEQDIRRMGGLAVKMPFTFLCFLIASLSLVGMPGFSGAMSKDQILHLANFTGGCADNWTNAFSYFFLNIMIYLTVAYTARLLYYVFLAPANYNKRYFSVKYVDVAYDEKVYAFIFTFLALMSIFGGRWFKNFFLNTRSGGSAGGFVDIRNDIIMTNNYHHLLETDTLFSYFAFFITLHAIFVAVYAIHFLLTNPRIVSFWYHNKTLYNIFCFFNRKCYFDDVYNAFIVRPLFKLSDIFNNAVENGVFRNFIFFLWDVLMVPIYSRISITKLTLVDHFVLTTFGMTLLLLFVYMPK